MGMTLGLLRVSKQTLEDFKNDSSLFEKRIYNDEEQKDDGSFIDIDKAWDGILFLLTGNGFSSMSHPLTKIFFSGQILDQEQDLGYGPAHYLTPAQVKEVHQQIKDISREDLLLNYDAKKMNELEIYPNIWDKASEEEFDYLQEYFIDVQKIYAEATLNDEAMITFIN